MDSSAEAITGRVAELTARAGLNMSSFARTLGYAGPSSVQRYFDPNIYKGGYLKRDFVARVVEALAGKGEPAIEAEEVWELAGPEFARLSNGAEIDLALNGARSRPLPMSSDGPLSHTSTVSLLGQAVGGPNGRFLLNGQQVGRVFAPKVLEGVKDAYAVRVYGTSMEPKFEAGETVWVDPTAPIRKGDYVIAQILTDEENTFEGYIKRFTSQSASRLRLWQFNPDDGEKNEVEFAGDRVHRVHKIVFQQLA